MTDSKIKNGFVFGVMTIALVSGAAFFHRHVKPAHARRAQRTAASVQPDVEWGNYGNGLSGTRYSPLSLINKSNLNLLSPAWVFSTGHMERQKENKKLQIAQTAFEATPIMVDRKLFLCDPFNIVFALDAKTGEKIWSYDPDVDGHVSSDYVCRGVSTWKDPEAVPGQECAREIFVGTTDARLIALDAETGKPCPRFGENGQVNLKDGLGDLWDAEYYVTSPPTVTQNLVVTSAMIEDNLRRDGPSGVVRAFDARSGKLTWAWDAAPPGYKRPKGETGKWTRATPNAWAVFSADEKADMIFIPTGGPSLDLFGGLRNGLDYYGSSVVALQASTGRYLWHFQTVHHDLWDYDVAAQPVLFTRRTAAGDVPAIAQATKVGHVFVLDRMTGKPLFPVEERPVPQSDVEGEQTSPTQPFPVVPEPLYQTTEDLFKTLGCFGGDKGLRYDGVFTPPSLNGGISYPGPVGGTDWGGACVDPNRQIMVLNQNNMPITARLIRKDGSFHPFPLTAGVGGGSNLFGAPYAATREMVKNAVGFPCFGSPAGELIAIDLTSGAILWRKPFGSVYHVMAGAPSMGGSMITAAGLVFIGASWDSEFRAFDVDTGDVLWSYRLPAPGMATPMTYSIDGEQYVVIAAGGHGNMMTKLDDKVMAFKLQQP